jgi:hypothetical protein
MNQLLPWLVPLLGVAWFLLVWCGTGIIVARVGGWIALAQRYRATQRFEGQRWRFQDAGMRWFSNYGKALTVGANAEGLYLAMTLPIFPGHPPLFIPWSETKMEMKRSFWQGGDYLEIHFPEVPTTVVKLRKKLAAKIAKVVGPALVRS